MVARGGADQGLVRGAACGIGAPARAAPLLGPPKGTQAQRVFARNALDKTQSTQAAATMRFPRRSWSPARGVRPLLRRRLQGRGSGQRAAGVGGQVGRQASALWPGGEKGPLAALPGTESKPVLGTFPTEQPPPRTGRLQFLLHSPPGDTGTFWDLQFQESAVQSKPRQPPPGEGRPPGLQT